VLDGGATTIGVESTIVDFAHGHPAILRLGGVDAATIEAIVGAPLPQRTRGEVAAPGTLERHYSPAADVVLVEPGEVAARAIGLLAQGMRVGLLAIAAPSGLPAGLVILPAPADADDYARVLYARLRAADEQELDTVLVIAPPPDGIGAAVTDRLARAAASGRIR
jgi:L-threonylcarbamoyladenylate synthase